MGARGKSDDMTDRIDFSSLYNTGYVQHCAQEIDFTKIDMEIPLERGLIHETVTSSLTTTVPAVIGLVPSRMVLPICLRAGRYVVGRIFRRLRGTDHRTN